MGKCRGEGHAAPPSVSPLAQNDDITRERGGGWVAKSKHRQYGGKEEGVDELFILCTPTPGFTQKRVFFSIDRRRILFCTRTPANAQTVERGKAFLPSKRRLLYSISAKRRAEELASFPFSPQLLALGTRNGKGEKCFRSTRCVRRLFF